MHHIPFHVEQFIPPFEVHVQEDINFSKLYLNTTFRYFLYFLLFDICYQALNDRI
jgi:hypothetical protein